MLVMDSTGCRIIPADAGSTHPFKGLHQPSKDHPRGCGEHRRYLERHV